MIELLLPYGFDTLECSWVKATISICTLANYSVAKKHQHPYTETSTETAKKGSSPEQRRFGGGVRRLVDKWLPTWIKAPGLDSLAAQASHEH
jgi:hypothetical protein